MSPRKSTYCIPRQCRSIAKAINIIRLYVLGFYAPIHQNSWRDTVRCLPLLLLIECMVYQADAVAENSRSIDLARTKNRDFDALTAKKDTFIRLLKRLDVYDPIVEHELHMGEQFIRLENRMTSGNAFDRSDVMRAAELRPSDVRLLHRLLLRTLKKPYDEELLSLLWPVEVLADIGGDFIHYAHDVDEGSYNTYDMFVRLYREEAPVYMRMEIEKYESLFLERLARRRTNREAELAELCGRLYRKNTATIPTPRLRAR